MPQQLNTQVKIRVGKPNMVSPERGRDVEEEHCQSQTGPEALFLSNIFWEMMSLFIKKNI